MKLGKKMSEEQKAKRRGRPAWNKGLKGAQAAWNKGKTLPPLTDEHKKKCSSALKGHKTSEDTKRKISEKLKGKVSPQKGAILSEITKEKMRLAAIKRYSK